ncbi:hypothetical protein ACFPAF_00080 [Hymenobacter endophyticus]|uniref:Uncharacterized protein n=1 Tax=Hymenobacter endophyticus TaxID=3076335 RepID=A0ABU3TBR2_9BACT|nr:hypothetical protein [Hymenobacter endophyticus]MDU0368774.1 hypothetical protein [Hymenobacter endophyticus]
MEESFSKEFCEFLEYHLTNTFAHNPDARIKGLWCDGVLPPVIDSHLTKKHVNDTRRIVTTAFIGYYETQRYGLSILLGRYSLRRYSRGHSLQDCVPDETASDWYTLDIDNRRLEIRLL